jgi:hypothetical protein
MCNLFNLDAAATVWLRLLRGRIRRRPVGGIGGAEKVQRRCREGVKKVQRRCREGAEKVQKKVRVVAMTAVGGFMRSAG